MLAICFQIPFLCRPSGPASSPCWLTFCVSLHPVVDDEPGSLHLGEVHLLDRGPEEPEEVGHEAVDQLQIPLDKDGIGSADLILVPRPHEFLVQLAEGRCHALLCAGAGQKGHISLR